MWTLGGDIGEHKPLADMLEPPLKITFRIKFILINILNYLQFIYFHKHNENIYRIDIIPLLLYNVGYNILCEVFM